MHNSELKHGNECLRWHIQCTIIFLYLNIYKIFINKSEYSGSVKPIVSFYRCYVMLKTNMFRSGFECHKSAHDVNVKRSYKTKEGSISLTNNHFGGAVSQSFHIFIKYKIMRLRQEECLVIAETMEKLLKVCTHRLHSISQSCVNVFMINLFNLSSHWGSNKGGKIG